MNKKITRSKNLDILRGLAIFLVFLFHLKINYFQLGFLGVDIFFVLSGFLMFKYFINGVNYENLKFFFINRTKRILPVYFFVSLITLIIFFYKVLPHEFYVILKSYFFNSIFLTNISFWADESYFGKINLKPLLHFWSLAVEIQFYIFLPIIIFLFKKNRISIFIILLISLILYLAFNQISQKTAFFLFPTRLWQFCIGIICAHFFYSITLKKNNKILKYIGEISLSLIIITIFAFPIFFEEYLMEIGYVYFSIIISILTSIVIFFGLNNRLTESLLGTIFSKLGVYSFSIYAVHFPIIVFLNYIPFKGTNIHLSENLILNSLTITFFFSILCYYLFEKKYKYKLNLKFFSIIFIISNFLISFFIYLNFLDISKKFLEKETFNILFAKTDKDEFRCGKKFKILNLGADYCILNKVNEDRKKVILFGDSQADSLKYHMKQTFEKRNTQLYIYNKNYKYNDQEMYNLVKKFLIKEDFDGIIIHNFLGNTDLNLINKLKNEIEDTKIVYILPPPIYKNDIMSNLYSNKVLKRKREELITYQDLIHNNYNNYNLLEQIKFLETHNISYVNLPKYFCSNSNNVCKKYDKEFKLFYHDHHHLTKTGSKFLIPAYEEVLKKFNF